MWTAGSLVMAYLAGKGDIGDLTFADIRKLVNDGSVLTRDNLRLKSFTMVFGTNGVLTQHAYKKIGKNEVIYKAIVKRLLKPLNTRGKKAPLVNLLESAHSSTSRRCASRLSPRPARKSPKENGLEEIGYR